MKKTIKKRKTQSKPSTSRAGVGSSALLADLSAITHPDYHALNVHAGRNDRLLHAVLAAYVKHHLGREEIGWNQLSDILYAAICEAVGDDAFCDWLDRISDSANRSRSGTESAQWRVGSGTLSKKDMANTKDNNRGRQSKRSGADSVDLHRVGSRLAESWERRAAKVERDAYSPREEEAALVLRWCAKQLRAKIGKSATAKLRD